MVKDITVSTHYSAAKTNENPAPRKLDDRLAEIALPEGDAEGAAADKALGVIRDELIGLLPFGGVVNKVLEFHDELEAEMREKKKELLIEGALHQLDSQGDALGKLKAFVTSPYGSTLLTKVLQIASDYPPDEHLLSSLSAAIAYMARTDFRELFSQHKFALGQIQRLTPQALTVLGSAKSWPLINYASRVVQNGRAGPDWRAAAATQLAEQYGLSSDSEIKRLEHILHELERDGLLFGKNVGQGIDNRATSMTLEPAGLDLLPYLAA